MKKRIMMLAMLVALLLLTVSAAASGSAGVVDATSVSPALSYLAARTGMAMSAMVGNPVQFSKDAFLRAVNRSDLSYITITGVPSEKEGRILVGSTAVSEGQRISAGNLSQMSFVFADGARSGSFRFAVDGNAYSHICQVNALTAMNYAPTVKGAPGLVASVSTHSGVQADGTLYASDPEEDELTYRIVCPPEHGSVVMTDVHKGTYEYQPSGKFTGTDTFEYAVFDQNGNWGPSASVTVRVIAAKTAVTYCDLPNGSLYHAALAMTENGIMSGTSVGGKQYFRPEEQISRADFVVAMLHAAGITDVPDADCTAFVDDAEISVSMKGYISAAYSLGYVTGSVVNGRSYFYPNEGITRAEAAVLISRITGLSGGAVAVFADSGSIPAWASDAVSCLYRQGILTTVDGRIAPTDALTRGGTAVLLERLMRYMGTA